MEPVAPFSDFGKKKESGMLEAKLDECKWLNPKGLAIQLSESKKTFVGTKDFTGSASNRAPLSICSESRLLRWAVLKILMYTVCVHSGFSAPSALSSGFSRQ